MFVIVFKQHGALNCQQRIYGPYEDYMAAENALSDGTVPCLYGQGGRPYPEAWRNKAGEMLRQEGGHRFIQQLVEPMEVGETGPDWEPTAETAYYAQRGIRFAFGPTKEAAMQELHNDEDRQEEHGYGDDPLGEWHGTNV